MNDYDPDFEWKAIRGIPPKEEGNRVFFPTDKVLNGVVAYESQYERDCYLLLDHDPSVIRFQHQPCIVTWTNNQGKPKKYSLDCLIKFKQLKPFLAEIKDDDTYEEIKDDPDTKLKWESAKKYAEKQGWTFKVLTGRQIRIPRLANIWFCLGASKVVPFPRHLTALRKLIPANGLEYNPLCFKLAEELGIEQGKAAQVICYAIYHGEVWVPTFSTQLLSTNTLIYCRSTKNRPFSPLWEEFEWLGDDELHPNTFEAEKPPQIKKNQNISLQLYLIPKKYRSLVEIREKIVKAWL